MKNLKGKIAVVTGAGSGMGRCMTLQLLEKGAIVIATDKNSETLYETKSMAPKGEIHVFTVDAAKENSSIRESFAFHYSLEKFIFRNFSIGFQANLNSVNIQNYDPSHLGSGGYSLLLFKTYFGNNFTAPLRTYNLRRSINNYSLVFGHTFEYGKFLFYPRVMFGGGRYELSWKDIGF